MGYLIGNKRDLEAVTGIDTIVKDLMDKYGFRYF